MMELENAIREGRSITCISPEEYKRLLAVDAAAREFIVTYDDQNWKPGPEKKAVAKLRGALVALDMAAITTSAPETKPMRSASVAVLRPDATHEHNHMLIDRVSGMPAQHCSDEEAAEHGAVELTPSQERK